MQEECRQCETDQNAAEIAEDQILELLHRREVDAADPDEQQQREEDVRQQLQLKRERLAPEEKSGSERPQHEQNRAHAKHGGRHVAVMLHRDTVRKIARQDDRKAARKQLREYKGVNDRPQKDCRLICTRIEDLKEHLNREHHACEERKRP